MFNSTMGLGLLMLLSILAVCLGLSGLAYAPSSAYPLSEWFLLDGSSLYLSMIAILFSASFFILGKAQVSKTEGVCLLTSLVSCLVCFSTSKVFLFWVSYEMTMIPLLVGLVSESPYSERFLAGWYLLSYVLVTSLPLLLVLLYASLVAGSPDVYSVSQKVPTWVSAGLFILFVTKVPLPPFHSWLPVVHAEATSLSSVALSGYVMKLGLMGVIRLCGGMVSEVGAYVQLCFLAGLLFYVVSYSELDAKRWLAFLSLVHILVAVVGLSVLSVSSLNLSVVFCLGHGLSAAVLFYLFSCGYSSTGSRNWVVLGQSTSVQLVWRMMFVVGLLTVASFPPSLSFLSEVLVVSYSLTSFATTAIFSVYLFAGGLVPLLLLSHVLVGGSTAQKSLSVSLASKLVLAGLFVGWLLYTSVL